MTTEIIPIENRQQWLAERVKDITSTEVSVLYGLSPYKSEFELYHEKRDQVVVSFEPNERMRWGTRLESVIAQGAAEEQGWDIRKLDVYIRNPEVRIGSSFDFEILSSSDGPGILEIKNVDGLQYARNWIDDGAGGIEAPEHIELQVQHQLEVSGRSWAAIVALVGGNTIKVAYRHRDQEIGADIRRKVAEFWARIQSGRAPDPDYTKDADFICKQLRNRAQDGLVAQADADLEALLQQYQHVSRSASEADKAKQAIKAQILDRIGEASKLLAPFGTLSCGMVSPSQGTLVTADMVGTYIGARSGYRNFKFNPKKEK